MNLKSFLKIIGIILVFVILQSYFINPDNLVHIIDKWKNYFMTIIISIFIAILLEPIVGYLKKKSKINDILAISLSIAFVVLVFIILSLIIIPEIISSLKVLNDIYPYISEKATKIGKNLVDYLAKKNIYTVNMDEVNNYFTNFISNNTTNITKLVSSLLGSLVDWTIGFTNLFLSFVLAFLILLDKKHLIKTLENIIIIIFGVKNTPYIMNKLKLSKDIFLSYVSGKIIVSAIVGLCVYIILLITGTPYAALSAILLGVGNMIPYVGSIIGGIIAFFLILLVSPIKTIILLIAIIISQLVDGFIVGPKIIGNKVGLNTFWVMISMIIFGNLFGLIGMFLGIPILSIIRLFYIDLLKAKQGGEQ
ncbi:AI-2E family transporter [Fusobacterium canifelinum]|uniref:AI-2E family transporter n=1 Tax=Fusobacterium canifelinum TaxID=285729 RepID=A0A3P1UVJ0_9FUSO|nr:AI-2E family transporter [Fusobacterium canifelinum]QQB74903.1 AI-2E family transporter [Fusobacterium canifelinum]RRD25175.1 AI-2E family transporter [Fusobacterium canifelinum]